MPRSVAVNVGANTSLPGFRAPIRADGTFEFVPIPEREPTATAVPTYGDLAPHLETSIPDDLRETPVHLDPEFAEYPFGEADTYGDEHGVKAGPLSELRAGDHVLFYATLSTASEDPPAWQPPTWGAYLVGGFRLAVDAVTGAAYREADPALRERFASNAHVKRETFDARVLLSGDPDGSGLFDRALPLSAPEGGATANPLVTERSSDSGRGPWWRRPLRFDADATADVLAAVEDGAVDRWA